MLTAGTKVEKDPEAIYYEEIISRLINWKYVCGTRTHSPRCAVTPAPSFQHSRNINSKFSSIINKYVRSTQ